ncbi:MAG: hypothetical protein IJN40_03720 [Clostridia bacterium]|nr:hypothetical protein [Clostridia bacterium]
MTHTQNCLYCDKVYENMKGYFVINLNKPRDYPIPLSIKIQSTDYSIDIILMTDSCYIGKVDKTTHIYATLFSKFNSSSDYITINPNEFTHIELDFDYSIYKNKYILDKILLKKIQHVESVY